jgi:PTS system nitrogen regulatory IIA component
MRLTDVITPAAIAVHVHLDDKAHALRFAAGALAARSGLSLERILEALAAREELGSTGIGRGIAVPHVSLPGLDQPYALFCTLAEPIDFEAIDGRPVDLIFTVITPPNAGGSSNGGGEAITYLAAVSRMLRNEKVAQALRNADNPWSVHDIVGMCSSASGQFAS